MTNICIHCGLPLAEYFSEVEALGLTTINEKFPTEESDDSVFKIFEKYQLPHCCRIQITTHSPAGSNRYTSTGTHYIKRDKSDTDF